MKHSNLISVLPLLCGSALVFGCPGNTTEDATNGGTDTESDSDEDSDSEDSVTLSTTDTLTTADPDTTDTDPSDTLTTTDPDTTDTDPTDPSTSTDPTTETESDTDETTDTDATTTDTDGTTTETGTGECQVVDLESIAYVGVNANFARYQAGTPLISLDDPDIRDLFRIEFISDATGEFDLTAEPNDNFQLCEQCIYAPTDIVDGKMTATPTHIYFQSAGSVSLGEDPLSGDLDLTATGVRLIEVTIAKDGVVTPVEDGGCVDVADGTITTLAVDAAWDCNDFYFGAADGCDCGCGVTDPDCEDMTLDVCEFCNNNGSCSEDACAGNMDIDPENNGVCL